MRTTKHTTLTLLAALALINFNGQAEEPVISNGRTYQGTKTDDRNSAYERNDSDRRLDRNHRASTDSMHGKNIQASEIIGKKVVNDQGERLGKISDLIVSDDFTIKYAVLSVGGAMGVGGNKIAVPVNDLNCSGDSVRLSATKEQLKNAANYPSGEWSTVSGQTWTRDIHGYYGTPIAANRDLQRNSYSTDNSRRFERDRPMNFNADRETVRTKQGAGAEALINHSTSANLFDDSHIGDSSARLSDRTDRTENSSDLAIRQSVNDTIRKDYTSTTAQAVSVTVENGEVTLRGSVASNSEKQNIESRVKAMNGVSRVNNQLTVRE